MAGTVKRERDSTPADDAAGKRSFRLMLLLIALAVGALLLGRRPSGPPTGAEARDFALPVVSGTPGEFHLAAQRGTPVLLEVFASWCGVCRRNAPTIGAAASARRQREVKFVGVNVDDRVEEASRTAREWGITYDVLHDDGRFAKAYGIESLPTFVLIDGDGKVRRVNVGALKANQLEQWLAEVGAARVD